MSKESVGSIELRVKQDIEQGIKEMTGEPNKEVIASLSFAEGLRYATHKKMAILMARDKEIYATGTDHHAVIKSIINASVTVFDDPHLPKLIDKHNKDDFAHYFACAFAGQIPSPFGKAIVFDQAKAEVKEVVYYHQVTKIGKEQLNKANRWWNFDRKGELPRHIIYKGKELSHDRAPYENKSRYLQNMDHIGKSVLWDCPDLAFEEVDIPSLERLINNGYFKDAIKHSMPFLSSEHDWRYYVSDPKKFQQAYFAYLLDYKRIKTCQKVSLVDGNGDKLGDILGNILGVNDHVKEIYISNFRVSSKFTDLTLEDNVVGVAATLEINPGILKLSFVRSKLTDKEVKIIAEGLRSNNQLRELDLSNNDITDEGAKALLDVLRSNSTICHIDLKGNKITGDMYGRIKERLEENKNPVMARRKDELNGPESNRTPTQGEIALKLCKTVKDILRFSLGNARLTPNNPYLTAEIKDLLKHSEKGEIPKIIWMDNNDPLCPKAHYLTVTLITNAVQNNPFVKEIRFGYMGDFICIKTAKVLADLHRRNPSLEIDAIKIIQDKYPELFSQPQAIVDVSSTSSSSSSSSSSSASSEVILKSDLVVRQAESTIPDVSSSHHNQALERAFDEKLKALKQQLWGMQLSSQQAIYEQMQLMATEINRLNIDMGLDPAANNDRINRVFSEPALQDYYLTVRKQFGNAILAAHAISSGLIDQSTDKVDVVINGMASAFSSVPVLGIVSSFLATGALLGHSVSKSQAIKRLEDLAIDTTVANRLADDFARQLTHAKREQILHPQDDQDQSFSDRVRRLVQKGKDKWKILNSGELNVQELMAINDTTTVIEMVMANKYGATMYDTVEKLVRCIVPMWQAPVVSSSKSTVSVGNSIFTNMDRKLMIIAQENQDLRQQIAHHNTQFSKVMELLEQLGISKTWQQREASNNYPDAHHTQKEKSKKTQSSTSSCQRY